MMNLTAQTPAPTTPTVIGLTEVEAAERLAEFGPNTLPEPEPPSPLKVFLIQFRNPIIYILLLASALSFATGRIEDALFILVVLLINASIGTYQEYSADRAAAALRKLEQPSARVIAAELGRADSSQPPLVARLLKFTNALALFVGLAALVLVVAGFMRGLPLHDLVMMSVGLAVSAVPEGLPIAISVALAVSMRRMAARNVIVRSMPAVEALGSITMIATDKTGTLTSNVQTVTEIRLPDGTDIALDAHADLDRCEIRASGLDGGLVRERARRLLRALLANEGTLVRRDDRDRSSRVA
ncbi:HAD-IC family P-type ATPase [Rhizobium sp. LARHSG275]